MLAFLLVCTNLAAPLEISALHCPVSEIAEHRIEFREPDHTHFEQDKAMLEYGHLDLHSPVITGSLIQPIQVEGFLDTGNGGRHDWWAATPAGRRRASAEFYRHRDSQAAARFRQSRGKRPDPLKFQGKHRPHC